MLLLTRINKHSVPCAKHSLGGFPPFELFRSRTAEDSFASRAAIVPRLMVRPVFPRLRWLANLADDGRARGLHEVRAGTGATGGPRWPPSLTPGKVQGQADCFIGYPLYSTMSKMTIFESGSRSGDGSSSFLTNSSCLPACFTCTIEEWICLVVRIAFKIHLRYDDAYAELAAFFDGFMV